MVLVSGVAPAWAGGPGPARGVLVLYTEPRLTPEFAAAEESLRETLEERSGGRISVSTQHLDFPIDADSGVDQKLAQVMRSRFERSKPDLVIVARGAARFTIAHRGAIFSGVPLVFLGFQRREIAALRLDAATTAVFVTLAWAATLDIALRLHPDTQRVVVLNGASVADGAWEAQAREDLAPYVSRLDVTYLTGLPLDRLRAELVSLPDRTIVLLGPMVREVTDAGVTRGERIQGLLHASLRPVYGLSEARLGEGIVGGRLWSAREHGVRIAEVVLRVLNGQGGLERGVEVAPGPPMFDARQLERWRVPEARLPAGSIVRFRPPSAWQQHGWLLVWVGALAALAALVAAGLLLEHNSRRRAQRSLQAHLRFERFLEHLATRLAALPASEINHRIEESLDQSIEALGLDRAEVTEFAADGTSVQLTCSRSRVGVEPVRDILDPPRFAGTMERLRQGEAVVLASPGQVAVSGIGSLTALPLQVRGVVIGALWFGTTRGDRTWSDELMRQMGRLAEILGDAVARRRADEMAREAEQRFRAAADEAPALIWMSGPDARCTFFNKAWLDFTGRTLAQELGDGWADGVAPEDYQRCLDTYLDAFRSRIPFRLEYRLRRADGTYGWIADTGVPRYAPDGTFLGYVGSSVDVTDLKSAQGLVEESTALLHRAKEEARHEREELAHALRLTTMGELIASLSHEINQPLAAIITAAQATRRMLERSTLSTQDTREALDDIIADGQRAAQVIRRVRALLRKDHSERTRVDINGLIVEVAHLVQSDAGRRRVPVRLDLAPALPLVLADSIQIEQVLLNVLINAVDATTGVAEPREVTMESERREPGILEIRVRDTGVGVDAVLLDKIFEPFVTTKAEGLGMGLSISRSIVQAHGGRIWATPNRDRGLTVHLELPCEETLT